MQRSTEDATQHTTSAAPRGLSWMRPASALITLLIVSSCGDTGLVSPTGPQLTVCHRSSATAPASLITILASERARYQSQSAYVAKLSVSKTNTPGDSIHFRTITDALASAKAGRIARNELTSAACRITIEVAPGTYAGTTATTTDPALERFPLIIDVPDISLVGSFKMGLDANGRATGTGTTSDESRIVATPALVYPGITVPNAFSEPMFILNATTTGQRGDGAIIEGFVMNSGHAATDVLSGGQAILSLRTQNVVIRGNKFEANFTERVDLRVGSGTIEKNHSSGRGETCDFCIAGPGTFTVRDNTIVDGGIPGVLSVPAALIAVPSVVEQTTLPATSLIVSTITNNEIRGHQRVPVGVGIRIAAMGVGAPSVAGTSRATVSGNNLVNNRFGMIIEAGFPVATGVLRGDVEFTSSANTFSNICQNNLYVSFARHTTGLGLNSNPYFRNSTYTLSLGADIPFASVWYANPANLGNALIVNGNTIAAGTVHSYNAAKVCP